MYESGDLEFEKYSADTRTENYDSGEGFILPHSCDEWVIGDLEHAKLLYKELGELIKKHS